MTARVDLLSAVIEEHLSTGVGCRCGKWLIDSKGPWSAERPFDPRAQHRRHVAEMQDAALDDVQEGGAS